MSLSQTSLSDWSKQREAMGFTDRAGKDRAWKVPGYYPVDSGNGPLLEDPLRVTNSDEGVASVELRGEWNIYSLRKEKIPFVGKRGQNVQERG